MISLPPDILNVKHQDRQRVNPAAKLLSKSVSDAILQLFPGNSSMIRCAKFVSRVDNWFDCFNSYTKYDYLKKAKNGFRIHLEHQLTCLEEMAKEADSLRVYDKRKQQFINAKQPWQKGIAISSTCLPLLYNDVKERYGITYILTTRVNQDALENLFSRLRSMGGANAQFGAVHFSHRLRNFILGAGRNIPIERAAVQLRDEDDEILLSSITEELDTVVEENIEDDELLEDFNEACQYSNPEDAIALEDDDEDIEIDEVDNILEDFNGTRQYSLPEEEGFNYMGGYLAKKDDKSLAVKNNNLLDHEDFIKSKWLDMRNVGGLSYPKKTFVADLKKANEYFEIFHKDSVDGLNREPNVTKGFRALLIKVFPQYTEKLLKRYSMARTMFRLRNIQSKHKQLQQESARSRKKKIDFAF